jgi:hypothetical protein
LNGLGEAALADDRPGEARDHHAAARTIATGIGNRDEQARADTGLGRAHHALHRDGHARTHFQRALAFYADFDAAEATGIRASLDDIGNRVPPRTRR